MDKKSLQQLAEHGIQIYGDLDYRGHSPLETAEQVGFLVMLRKVFPELAEIAVHIRNEGKMSARKGHQLNTEGRNTGASDIMIPTCPPIVIELKRRDHTTSSISAEQIAYLVRSQRAGAFACVALGQGGAMEAVEAWHTLHRSK